MVVTTFSVPPTTKSGSIPKDLHHNMRLLLRRYPLLLMKVQWLCVFWMSGVSPNHCLKTLQTCSPQGCNAEVHGDLCMSAKCCSVCIQAGTYTSVASMQMSSLSALTLTATTLVWCIDIQCSLKRYTKECQYMIYISFHIGHPALWSCLVHPRVNGRVSSLASGCV